MTLTEEQSKASLYYLVRLSEFKEMQNIFEVYPSKAGNIFNFITDYLLDFRANILKLSEDFYNQKDLMVDHIQKYSEARYQFLIDLEQIVKDSVIDSLNAPYVYFNIFKNCDIMALKLLDFMHNQFLEIQYYEGLTFTKVYSRYIKDCIKFSNVNIGNTFKTTRNPQIKLN